MYETCGSVRALFVCSGVVARVTSCVPSDENSLLARFDGHDFSLTDSV